MIGVTGATGRLGGRVARRLAAAGLEQRLLVRDPARAPSLAGSSVAQASFSDADAVRAGLDGVSVLFLVSAAEDADRLDQHRTSWRPRPPPASSTSSTPRSSAPRRLHVHPGPRPLRDRAAHPRDAAMRSPSCATTSTRTCCPTSSATTASSAVRRVTEGRAAFVARADIARVATAVLSAPEAHADRTYDLTGPEALTLDEVATVLTTGLRRSVTYVDETVPEAYESRAHYGAPDWQVDAWVSTYTAIRAGEVAASATTSSASPGTRRRPWRSSCRRDAPPISKEPCEGPTERAEGRLARVAPAGPLISRVPTGS